MGQVTGCGYSVCTDRTTFSGQGVETGRQLQEPLLTKATELVLFLGGGIVYASCFQTLGTRITKELNKNTDSWPSHLGGLEWGQASALYLS